MVDKVNKAPWNEAPQGCAGLPHGPAMKSKGPRYNGETPAAANVGGPHGKSTVGSIGPHYGEAKDGLPSQDGGEMAKPASGADGLGVQFGSDKGPRFTDTGSTH